MFGITPLVPAYGRDYKSKKAAQADFDADLDFVTAGGQYINRSQLLDLPGFTRRPIEVRSADKRKLFMLAF
ncbi:MAG: hypothetical protein V3V96_15480 [Acidiferrobacterales bacterium]